MAETELTQDQMSAQLLEAAFRRKYPDALDRGLDVQRARGLMEKTAYAGPNFDPDAFIADWGPVTDAAFQHERTALRRT